MPNRITRSRSPSSTKKSSGRPGSSSRSRSGQKSGSSSRPSSSGRSSGSQSGTRRTPSRTRRARSGESIFGKSIQKTNLWLKELAHDLATEDRHRAYVALRGLLHSLRDRLPLEEVVQIGAQLPMLVRGFYYEGWDPTDKPVKYSREEFLDSIASHFRNEPTVDAEEIVRTTFGFLQRHISAGEVQDIISILPRQMVDLLCEPLYEQGEPVGTRE